MRSEIKNKDFKELAGVPLAMTISAVLFMLLLFVTATAFSAPEKRTSSIQLSFNKKADLSKTAVAFVKGKNMQGKFFPVRKINVSFFIKEKNEKKLLGIARTDVAGKATIELPKEMPLDENRSFTLSAKIENDTAYEDAEEQVHYKDAGLSLQFDKSDTTHLVTAMLTETDKDGKQTPVKGVEIKFYTQRLFGVMPAGEDYAVSTDENGKAEFTYPKDIKGDTAGTAILVARIDDNENYGNIESKADTKWGSKLAVDKNPFPRALWEPYAPIPLVLTISILFGGVWCTYVIIFNFMRKIKKDGDKTKAMRKKEKIAAA